MNRSFWACLAYFQIFASMITAFFLTFMPSLISYKQFVVVTSVCTAFAILVNILTTPKTLGLVMKGAVITLSFLLLYSLTQTFYHSQSDRYNSFYMVLYGQTLPAVLLASLVTKKEDVIIEIKRLSPLMGTIFALIAAFTSFFTTTTTSAGYIDSDNGLNYQSTSYLAAYSVGLLLYYYAMKDDIKWISFFNHSAVKSVLPLLIILDFISCLIAGGRGGLVLLIIQLLLFLYIWLKKDDASVNQKFKHIFTVIVIGAIGFLSVRYASHSTIETSGFERIIGAIRDSEDSGRSIIRAAALQSFESSPILGHGIGSIFFEIGEYSHNCFTDILVEAGIVGCLVFLVVLYRFYKKAIIIVKLDVTDYFWLMIFLDGFIMSLFSGYYIAIIPAWWVMSFVFSKEK